MKKFILKLFFFLLPIILLYIFLEYKLSQVPNSYNQKKVLLEKQLNDVEVLVLGPSTALYGVNPDYFSHKGFNLADVSQSIFYDKRLTLKYADKMPKLKLVIITVSVFSLYGQLHDGKEEWRDYFYYQFWKVPYKDLPLFDVRKYSYIALYSMNITRQYIISDFRSPNMAPGYTPLGYVKNDSSGHLHRINDSLGMILANRINKEFCDYIKKDKNRNGIKFITNDIEELASYLQSKNIKIAFVNLPAYHTYSDHINKAILSLNDSIVNNLCKKYSCPHFNYLYDNRFTIDDFADNNHMGTIGATKFSKIIDREVIRPAFRQ